MRGKKNFVLLLLLMVAMVYLKAAFILESVIKVHLIQTWESWGWFHPKGKQKKQAAACPCMSPLGKCVLEDRLGPPGIELATSSCHWDLQAGKRHLIFFSSSFFSFTSFKSHESRHDTPGCRHRNGKCAYQAKLAHLKHLAQWSGVSAPPPCPSAGAFDVSPTVEWEQLHHHSLPIN